MKEKPKVTRLEVKIQQLHLYLIVAYTIVTNNYYSNNFENDYYSNIAHINGINVIKNDSKTNPICNNDKLDKNLNKISWFNSHNHVSESNQSDSV